MSHDLDTLTNKFGQIYISASRTIQKRKDTKRKVSEPIKVIIDPSIMNINIFRFPYVEVTSVQVVNTSLTYEYLNEKSEEYLDIKKTYAQNKLHVKSIKRVINPYLKKAFEMKRHFCYNMVQPVQLFHGTKEKHVDNICTFNFDYRLSGAERGHRYGMGVNFCKDPYFATNFCDTKYSKHIIIMADVLIKKKSSGCESMLVPASGIDTISGRQGTIFVKFNDNEFYPRYVIHSKGNYREKK